MQLAKISIKPIYIFKELVIYLQSQLIVLPAYYFLRDDVVGNGLTIERARLESVLKKQITPETAELLKDLLRADNDRYELSILKKEPKDFSYTEMALEIKKCILVKPLFMFSCQFLAAIDISSENIKHYASLVDYYTIYKLNRMNTNIVYIYLLCFVHNRYQRIKDNLINCLISYVRSYSDSAKQFARDKVYSQEVEGNINLDKVSRILDLFVDPTISGELSAADFKKQAFGILPKDKIPFMSRYISKIKFDEVGYVWDYHKQNAATLKKNLRPVFMNIDFASHVIEDELIKGVNFLKEAFLQGKSLNQFDIQNFPQGLIPTQLKRYLYEMKQKNIDGKSCHVKTVNGDKYEFLIYLLLRKSIESGDIFSKDSVRFRSFEDDLIDEARWQQKDIILTELALPALSTTIEQQLREFKVELENKYRDVNLRIAEGKNKHIKVTGKGEKTKWTLPYKKAEETVNNPIYTQLPQIGISALMQFVNSRTDFMVHSPIIWTGMLKMILTILLSLHVLLPQEQTSVFR